MPYKNLELRRAHYKANSKRINARQRDWARRNPDKHKAIRRREYLVFKTKPEKVVQKKETARIRRLCLRNRLITKYGGKCACCGEKALEFLCFDHINGNGRAERRKLFSRDFLMSLRDKKRDDIRVLCHNCNMALGFYGYCPHGNI